MLRPSILATVLLSSAIAPSLAADGGRSVILVLDASGSMNARLPDSATRIDAAKAAVADVVGKVAPGTRLALRVYGHQSPTQRKDCKDTALVVGFNDAGQNRATIVDATRGIRAQGYTPINHSLTLAAGDLGQEESAERIVILVSDGKETCEGDPCVTARALAAADAKLVVHTIGFGVDAAARRQLQCIAGMARGTYSDAGTSRELATALGEAASKPVPPPKKTEIVVALPRSPMGKLQIKGPDRDGHKVFDAATGQQAKLIRMGFNQQVDSVNTLWPTVEIAPGIYNVAFGPQLWKSVEVRAGETTVIEPGVLVIEGAAGLGAHYVIDPETEEVMAELRSSKNSASLIPSRFTVTFGELKWPDVELKPGQTTTLRPGVLKVTAPKVVEYNITLRDGRKAGYINTAVGRVAFPAGEYILEVQELRIPFELKEGQVVEIKLQ
jgi:hypothetical protein